MIPKIIHYCWFGRAKKSKKMIHCINSWKKFCPEYKIIEWNEDNFDVNLNEYTRYCYTKKKWAYLSDYVRLAVVKKYGGIYFDTDVEIINTFNSLLSYDAFYAFENKDYVATGLGFGSIANHPVIVDMVKSYENMVVDESGNMKMIGCPILNTQVLVNYGLSLDGTLQNLSGILILPVEYMNPYDDPTGRLNITDKTLSIHWYTKSALKKRNIFKSRITRYFHRFFGIHCFDWVRKE